MNQKNSIRARLCVVALLALLPTAAAAQQASITLKSSDVSFCNKQETAWSVTKTVDATGPVTSGTTVNWTVIATRDPAGAAPRAICAAGYVDVTNSGSAPATIGNIVVNLQRNRQVAGKNRWVSAAANVANASAGDGATAANIVANATQENASWNGAVNIPANYSASGARGTFTEGAGSGSLSFTDVDSNTIFAITPQQTIAAGQTVRLLFTANFDNGILQVADGESLRTEVIVTFGNAGARGGSGASASDIDIDGNGSIGADETNVRSVPTRITRSLPVVEICNDTVTLGDVFSATGSASIASVASNLPASTSVSGSWSVSGVVTGAGQLTNTADLTGSASYTSVVVGSQSVTDPVTGIVTTTPITAAVRCCEATDEEASAAVTVYEPVQCQYGTNADGSCAPPPALCTQPRADGTCDIKPGDFCSFTQGGYGSKPNGNNPGVRLATAFPSLYAGGVSVGGVKTMLFQTSTAVEKYLPAGGTGAALTTSLVNPTSSASGVFGGQVLTLRINVDMSSGGFLPGGFGSLVIDGSLSVAQFLSIANAALGGLPLPAGQISALNDMADNLNNAFDNCNMNNGWAARHLSRP